MNYEVFNFNNGGDNHRCNVPGFLFRVYREIIMWSHKNKFKGKTFTGDYERQKNGETHFHLNNSKGKTIARFRSYATAKRSGWSKVK